NTFNPVNKCVFVFLIEGLIEVNGTALNIRDGLGIWDTDQISIHCLEKSEFLIIETPVNQK
ncbi:MAG TPA: pirin family protein, partial [Puia sp.]|nr:pirin family protein [Puia sp.]